MIDCIEKSEDKKAAELTAANELVELYDETYPTMASSIPAATALPSTPATFGPIACINKKLCGLASKPTLLTTRAAIGTADTPAAPTSGLMGV